MLMQEERELIVEYGKKMSAARLSTGTSGNISIYNAEKGLMAISPSGIDYFSTQPEDVVIMDLEANIVDGARKPSSEWGLHTTFYKHKPQARAVVHTHSMYCTTFAVLGQPIRAVHYVIGDTGVATVPCAPYYPFGTLELAEAAIKVCGESNAVLLGNHGLVTSAECAARTSRVPTAWPATWSISRSSSTGPCASASPTSSLTRRWRTSWSVSRATASRAPKRPAIDDTRKRTPRHRPWGPFVRCPFGDVCAR